MTLLLVASLPSRAADSTGEPAPSPLTVPTLPLPESFQELPDLSLAAQTAANQIAGAGDGVAIAATVWGDPAMGCYVLAERVRFTTTATEITTLMQQQLATVPDLALEAPVWNGADGRSSFSFTRRDFQGTARLHIQPVAAERVTTVDLYACFHNQRYRQRSSDLCAAILEPGATAP